MPDEAEVKTHFTKFGAVNSVAFLRDTGELLEIYQQAQDRLLRSEIENERIALKKKLKLKVKDKETDRVDNLYEQYLSLVNLGDSINNKRLKLDKFPILSAIVVFESPFSKDVCLKAY